MEAENKIEELRRLGEAHGGDPNEIFEQEYWQGFRSQWESGLMIGIDQGQKKAMSDLNITLK